MIHGNKTYFLSLKFIREVKISGKSSFHIVSMEEEILVCDCKESVFEGLPCRHELCIYIKETLEIKSLNFQKRWTRDYFEYKELNEDISSEEENEDSDENQEIENEMDQSAEEEIQSDSLNKVKIIWFF